jgi:hypothetical protein
MRNTTFAKIFAIFPLAPRKFSRRDFVKPNKYGSLKSAHDLRITFPTTRELSFHEIFFNSETNKMIVKVYALIWVLGILAAGICYLTGNLGPMMTIVFGFLTFGMVFMGMISVLPIVSTHHSESKH